MAEHYTKWTVSVTKYCGKCKTMTTWSVMNGRIGSCQVCLKKLEDDAKHRREAEAAAEPLAKQDSLF